MQLNLTDQEQFQPSNPRYMYAYIVVVVVAVGCPARRSRCLFPEDLYPLCLPGPEWKDQRKEESAKSSRYANAKTEVANEESD